MRTPDRDHLYQIAMQEAVTRVAAVHGRSLEGKAVDLAGRDLQVPGAWKLTSADKKRRFWVGPEGEVDEINADDHPMKLNPKYIEQRSFYRLAIEAVRKLESMPDTDQYELDVETDGRYVHGATIVTNRAEPMTGWWVRLNKDGAREATLAFVDTLGEDGVAKREWTASGTEAREAARQEQSFAIGRSTGPSKDTGIQSY